MLRMLDGSQVLIGRTLRAARRVVSRVVLSALLLSGSGGALRAQDGSPGQKAAGEALLESAAAAAKRGQHAQALRDYEQALARLGRPTIYYNIGDTAAQLGNDERALSAFRDYLALSPNPRNRVEVEQRIAALEAKRQAAAGPAPVEPAALDLSPEAAAGTEQGSVAITADVDGARGGRRSQSLWWLWTGIGVAVVATVVAAVVVTTSDDPSLPARRGDVGGTIQTLEGR